MWVKMNWSTAVGTVSETRDMKVVRQGGTARGLADATIDQASCCVVPVNYLRWDVLNRGPEGDWGASASILPKCGLSP